MARPLRIEFPGTLYHVMNRGNTRVGDVPRIYGLAMAVNLMPAKHGIKNDVLSAAAVAH